MNNYPYCENSEYFLQFMQECSQFTEICDRMKTRCWDNPNSKIVYIEKYDNESKCVAINKHIGYI